MKSDNILRDILDHTEIEVELNANYIHVSSICYSLEYKILKHRLCNYLLITFLVEQYALTPIFEVVCNIKTKTGTNIEGDIPMTGDSQLAKAVTLPNPIVFPAVKIFFCSFS